MVRRLMALLVAVGLVVGLTSCTPPAEKRPTTGAKEPAKVVAPTPTPTPTPTPAKVVAPTPTPAPPKVVEPAPAKPVVPALAVGLPEGKVVTDRKAAIGVRATDQPIKLDAKLAEPAWKTAPALVGFLNQDGKAAKIDSRVLLTYDKDNLYVAVICSEPNTDKLKTGSKDIWDDDSLELYINTGDTDFFAFHLNAKNARWDRRSDLTWGGTGKWASGAAVVAGKAWVAEYAIPFKTLGVAGKAGTKLSFTAARNRCGDKDQAEYTAVATPEEAKDITKYLPIELK